VRTDGGPICASETTLGFKYTSSLLLLPLHITMLVIGARYLAKTYETKLSHLINSGRGINPSIMEYL
jgi:hypothetical protein